MIDIHSSRSYTAPISNELGDRNTWQAKVIGIDLGTTNSVVAVMEGGEPSVIVNQEGSRLTPSVVAHHQRRRTARGTGCQAPGRHESRKHHFFHQAVHGAQATTRSPEEAAARALQGRARAERRRLRLKRAASKYSPPEISAIDSSEAETGCRGLPRARRSPTRSSPFRRISTTRSGRRRRMPARLPGLNVLRIINEPTAAALAYGLDKKKDETIAVYDFGGGTFDISVLEVGEGVVEVKATNGDTHLGGDDLDNQIIEWLVTEFKKSEGIDLGKGSDGASASTEAAEKAKIELSTAIETEINLPFVTADQTGPKHLQMKLSRAKLEQLVDDLLQPNHGAGQAGARRCRPRSKEDRRSGARRRIDADAEGSTVGARVLRQGTSQRSESRRSRRRRALRSRVACSPAT